jgi:hypothetical protein
MQIDRRITNGLAWAGVLLVVGVPTADLLSAQFMGGASTPQVAVVSPEVPVTTTPAAPVVAPSTDVAAVTPSKPAVTAANVVDSFLQSGKPLPSYITGGGEAVAATPATKPVVPAQPAKPAETQQAVIQPATTTPTTRPPITTDPVNVAAIPPAKVAPVPMPLSMRPKPQVVPVVATTEPVLIVPDRVVAPVPPVDVTTTDFEDWESGPLSEYLAARQRQGGSSATVTYDPNGFYLDEGLNAPRPRRDQLVGPAQDDVYYAPFFN